MSTYKDTISIFGATGFLGQELIALLLNSGWSINLFTADKDKAYKILEKKGLLSPRIQIINGYTNLDSDLIESSYFVLNLMAGPFNYQSNDSKYKSAFKNLINAVSKSPETHYIHISCLGANSLLQQSQFPYLKHKGTEEDTVKLRISNYTLLRSGILFGKDDSFFNQYADALIGILHFYLPNEINQAKWQLTYVGDVVLAIHKILNQPDIYAAETYDLYSGETYQVVDLFKYIYFYTGLPKRNITVVPNFVYKWLSKVKKISNFGLIEEKHINIMASNFIHQPKSQAKSLLDLNIQPTLVKKIMSRYLFRN